MTIAQMIEQIRYHFQYCTMLREDPAEMERLLAIVDELGKRITVNTPIFTVSVQVEGPMKN